MESDLEICSQPIPRCHAQWLLQFWCSVLIRYGIFISEILTSNDVMSKSWANHGHLICNRQIKAPGIFSAFCYWFASYIPKYARVNRFKKMARNKIMILCPSDWIFQGKRSPALLLSINTHVYVHRKVIGSLVDINTLRPRQNGRNFAGDIFKWIFLNENVWIPIKISLKFVPQGSINNIPALVQIMAWRRPGDKPLSGPMMVRLPTHICVTRPQWVNTL